MVKLKRISILPAAKLFCMYHVMIGIILGIIATIGSVTGQEDDGFWSLGAWSLLVFPIVNAILGLLTGTFLAWSYNTFSHWLGSLEFEVE